MHYNFRFLDHNEGTHIDKYVLFDIVTCICVTIDGVWIGD
jgi:hypothetical protein